MSELLQYLCKSERHFFRDGLEILLLQCQVFQLFRSSCFVVRQNCFLPCRLRKIRFISEIFLDEWLNRSLDLLINCILNQCPLIVVHIVLKLLGHMLTCCLIEVAADTALNILKVVTVLTLLFAKFLLEPVLETINMCFQALAVGNENFDLFFFVFILVF